MDGVIMNRTWTDMVDPQKITMHTQKDFRFAVFWALKNLWLRKPESTGLI